MKAYYDLHIHSALSPCGDNDMTPNNIVNMSILNGQSIIAITDHNSCKNVRATVQVGKALGLCVVSGMELCTCEEIHCVCLFTTVDSAEQFSEYVAEHSMKIKNRTDIYGEQRILNAKDELTGIEQNLLIVGSDISISSLPSLIEKYEGVCFPAHIDRDSYSVIASLGGIPPECNFNIAEIFDRTKTVGLKEIHKELNHMQILHSSDAHYLESLKERQDYIELSELSAKCLVDTLKSNLCKDF